MKSKLSKRIPTLIAIMLFPFSYAKAQIVYTDVKPDSVISTISTTHSYGLDLNNDGTKDFIMFASVGVIRCRENFGHSAVVWIVAEEGTRNAIIDDKNNYALALDSLSVIGSSGSLWSDSNRAQILSRYSSCSGSYGDWHNGEIKYLGLKIITGRYSYHGWIRLSVSVDFFGSKIVIIDYAYNSVPNQPILAGEKSCASPSVTLSANGPLSFCAGDSVILTANGTGHLYQWKKNGKNIKGAIAQTYTAKAAGIYKCKVTNSCGSNTSKGDTVTISCINSSTNNEAIISKNTHIKVAPNPFSNSTTISFTLPQSQKVSLSIYDMNGRLIKTLANAQMQAGSHQLLWNAKGEKGNALVAGIYLLKLQAGIYAETKKLVVVK